MTAACLHCERVMVIACRGLCGSCYAVPAIRKRFPKVPRVKHTPPPWGNREPTMAELELMIAEQLPTMPTGPDAADKGRDRIGAIRVMKSKNRTT